MTARSYFCLLVYTLTLLASAPRAFAEPPQTAAKPAAVKPAAPMTHPHYLMYRTSVQQLGSILQSWDLQPQYSTGPMPLHLSFKSLADPELRQWVSHLPANTSITCGIWLGPMRNQRTRLTPRSTSLEAETTDFTQYCKSKQVMFYLLMSGG